ncbi:site-2 protease family protein [Serratia sp. NPDC087055]|uniref:site-2 protease family protein n=1 Tax=Serratia sp. NPDC087055 TaxID=3364516 RepID=UPI00384C7AFB
MSDSAIPIAATLPPCRYRDELICEPVEGAEKPKFRIYDPQNDIAYELGKTELALARLFNGERTVEQVQRVAQESLRATIALPKLAAFQTRLLQLGLLTHSGQEGGLKRDPATGITYGPLKRFLLINLIKMNPQNGLDRLYRRAPWLCSSLFNALLLLAVGVALGFLFSRWAQFSQDVMATYTQSWSWLAWHYPVILSSIAIHELGHALSCRHYRVRVTDFGIGVYTLLATGWVRPEQRTWSALSPGKRAITILMGPAASFYYAAVGIAIWGATGPGSPFHDMAVVMIVASCLSLIPTLLPIFNGDTYLALTEFFDQPRLRQRALRYCRQRLAGKPTENDKDSCLYWLVSLFTAFGWVLAWCGIAMMIFRLLP